MQRLGKDRIFKLGLVLLLALVLACSLPAAVIAQDTRTNGISSAPDPNGLHTPKQQLIDSIVNGFFLAPKEVREDLVDKGAVVVQERDDSGRIVAGGILCFEISDLVAQGIYHIDAQGAMQFGTAPTPASTMSTMAEPPYYKWAYMRTRAWYGDEFKYRGVQYKVDIPASIPDNGKTWQNLYNGHLTLTGDRDVEAGVGYRRDDWYTWRLIIYTEDTYTGGWWFRDIPEGATRSVTIFIDINSASLMATMTVYDPYSGLFVSRQQHVDSTDHRVTIQQEQCTFFSSGGWLATPQVKHWDTMVKSTSGTWINWNNSISTAWVAQAPLYETHGIENDRKWMKTWCTP